MPAFATHYLFARDMLPALRALDPSVTLRDDAVFYGTQGPDFLFFHRILPTMPGRSIHAVGSRMHRADPAPLFAAMRQYLTTQAEDRDAVLSYIYGFLCHYALDRTAHPYVYAMQARIIRRRHVYYIPGVIHNRIEFNLDVAMLQDRLGLTDARRFEAADTLSGDEKLLGELGRLLFLAAQDATGDRHPPRAYAQAFRDMKTMQHALTDRRGWKIPLVFTMELLIRWLTGPCFTTMMRHRQADRYWDYLNRSHASWTYPADPDRSQTASFPELYEAAKHDAIRLCTAFRDSLTDGRSMDLITEHRSFLTGVPVKQPVKKHSEPNGGIRFEGK